MRGLWIRFGIAAAVIVGGFAVTAIILNQTVYTASGFVRGYLDALARHDLPAVLAMAGPSPSSSRVDDLLTGELLADLQSWEVEETGEAGGVHTVVVDFVVDGLEGSTRFEVERVGSVLGIFPTWGFASSPLAQFELTVEHARDFTANGIRFVAPVQDIASTYLAFTPGAIRLGHDSEMLHADEQTLVLGAPDAEPVVTINARPTAAFLAAVDEQAKAYLDGCAAQQRLYPTGCPFGQHISDPNLASAPAWSISQYPALTLAATTIPGEWVAPPGNGSARLQVEVVDTSDGTILPFDQTIPFTIGFTVTFVGASELVVTPDLSG